MQFFDYDTILAVVDSDLNIAYLYNQTSHINSESSLLDELKNQTMDNITQTLIRDLEKLDFLSKKDGIGKNKIILLKKYILSLNK